MGDYHKKLHEGADPKLFEYAKELRNISTHAEAILWQRLRARQVQGLKFRRQHPLNRFIADFYCHQKKLVIELDGSVHDTKEQQELDKTRTAILSELGITVIRFRNEEVMKDMETVITKIINALAICK